MLYLLLALPLPFFFFNVLTSKFALSGLLFLLYCSVAAVPTS